MKKVYVIIILIFLFPLAVVMFINPIEQAIFSVYQQKLQIAFFSGFLTIGAFLLSLKTFVIIKLKEGLFDLEEYHERINEGRAINPKLTIYGPLKRLSTFLSLSVLGALITATLQMTIGFIPSKYAADICVAFAISTLILVLCSWFFIWTSLKTWFDILEKP